MRGPNLQSRKASITVIPVDPTMKLEYFRRTALFNWFSAGKRSTLYSQISHVLSTQEYDMLIDLNDKTSRERRANAWFIAEYAVLERRLELIDCYNNAVGPPSLGVIQVQEDFIKDRMEPSELIAFILVCKGLISAAEKRR